MIAGMVLSNLLYVVGAIVAATVVSAIVLLRHRKPRSLEAGIEMFSRELRALRPERPEARTFDGDGPGGPDPRARTARSGGPRSGSGVTMSAPGDGSASPTAPGHDEARAPSPNRESEPG